MYLARPFMEATNRSKVMSGAGWETSESGSFDETMKQAAS